jgi:hypothetical protein
MAIGDLTDMPLTQALSSSVSIPDVQFRPVEFVFESVFDPIVSTDQGGIAFALWSEAKFRTLTDQPRVRVGPVVFPAANQRLPYRLVGGAYD